MPSQAPGAKRPLEIMSTPSINFIMATFGQLGCKDIPGLILSGSTQVQEHITTEDRPASVCPQDDNSGHNSVS